MDPIIVGIIGVVALLVLIIIRVPLRMPWRESDSWGPFI